MGDYFLPLLVVLVLMAFIFQDGFVFTLVYLFAGTFALSRLWSQNALKAIRFRRDFTPRAFPGDTVEVKVTVENTSWFPVVWLLISESLSVDLVPSEKFRRVMTLPPKATREFRYTLRPKKRGYYSVGPLFASTGDVIGVGQDVQLQGSASPLIVYPEILQLREVNVPSRASLGRLRHTLPIFEDPARVRGKRPYISGDSLRRMDWKASAALGSLQVKLMEPTVSLQTLLVLNLNANDYGFRSRYEMGELAIHAAASLAYWISGRKEAVGLATNGSDPLREKAPIQPIAAGAGKAHLMRILGALARVSLSEALKFTDLLHQQVHQAPLGSSLIVITPEVGEAVFENLFLTRRRGSQVYLVACGRLLDGETIRARADYFHIPFTHIKSRSDLERWQ